MRADKRETPRRATAGHGISAGADTPTAIVAPTTLHHPRAILPAYAVFVMRKDDRWSRRLYISLTGATRAVERAKARGVEVQLQLVELVPVPGSPLMVLGCGAA